MGCRLVKTPNGKYAAFADPVDNFISYDMTREEALKFCADEWDLGPKASESKVQRADDDFTEDGGSGRYEEAMRTITMIHGKDEADKLRIALEL